MPLSLRGRPDRETAKAVVRRAVELGVTLIDTADAYALDHTDIGHNERLIAEALAEVGLRCDGPVVVATKAGMTRPDGRWQRDGRPEHLRNACHASLRALGVERISLYQFHSPDPAVDLADSVGALARLREEGKVAEIGLSNVSVDQIRTAERITAVATVQNALSAWDVGYRRSRVVEHCAREGIVFLAYAPLGGAARAARLGESPALLALGRELEATPQELALAWLLREAPIVVPIPGATQARSVESGVRALSVDLDLRTHRRLIKAFRTLPGSAGVIRRLSTRLIRLARR